MGSKNPNKIYMIDFGLSSSFLTQEGHHIEKQNIKKFQGNMIFASLDAYRCLSKSRRSDLQSAIYLIIYLLNKNYLPWCDMTEKFNNANIDLRDIIYERLNVKYTKRLMKMTPTDLQPVVKNILLLEYSEEPDYKFIIGEFEKYLKSVKLIEQIKETG